MKIDLNADLGEGCASDAELLTLVSSANIACGFHAGDPLGILKTLKQAEFNYTDIVYNHMKILETLGFMPNLTECVYCGNKMDVEEKVCFSSEKGGVLCRACSSALPHKTYNEGVIERILLFCKGRGERDYRLTDRVMDEGISSKKESKGYVFLERQIQDIMEGFMSYHLDVELRSYRLLKRYVFKQ